MAALITTDFQIPNNIAQGIFKKAQTGSALAQLSGARPQKFGQETNWILTSAPKAEIVGEGSAKSPTPTTYAPISTHTPLARRDVISAGFVNELHQNHESQN